MRNFIIILLLFTLNYCTSIVEIKPVRDFEIPFIKAGNKGFNYCTLNGEQYYFYLDKIVEKNLFIRNVETNKIVLTVPLNDIFNKLPRQENDMSAACIYIHSFDSIFILANCDRKIFLLNKAGQIKKTYKFTKQLLPEEIPYLFNCFSNSPFIEINKNEFICISKFQIYVGSREGRLAYQNLPMVAKIDIDNDTADINNIDIFFPYEMRISGDDYKDRSPSYTINKNKEIVYTFMITPYVYKFNYFNNELDSFFAKSKYIERKDIKPVDSIGYFEDMPTYVRKYSREVPHYESIYYNNFKNIYYRIAKHKSKYKSNNGKINNVLNWSIIILDEDFDILDEVAFLNDSIYQTFLCPTKEGFILTKRQTDKDKENEKLRLCEFEVKL